MSVVEFQAWSKIPRLFRDIVITEKIDGTNAAIGIEFGSLEHDFCSPDSFEGCAVVDRGGYEVNGVHNVARVYAQSRKRLINPGQDNFGFARWVWDNAETLVADLGEGVHYGEYWGQGIQRGYGLKEKRFSLFNVKRWGDAELTTPKLGVVPVLYRGQFSTPNVKVALGLLRIGGSLAAPEFMDPEGIVVYHTAGNALFKVTLENDETPKSVAA